MPSFVTIPSVDRAFRQVVSHVLEQTDRPASVESRIRRLYPLATVQPRGLSNEPQLLYVYREGRFEPDDSDRWWLDPEVARVRISLGTGLIVDANQRGATALGSHAIGRSFLDFVHPAARDDARVLFESIAGTSETTTTVLVLRADGTPAPLDLHAVRIDKRRVEVAYRAVEPRPATRA